jgi:hypothetical protein
MSHSTRRYRVHWVGDLFGIDPHADNVDVFVDFEDGKRFVATLFTQQNIRELFERYEASGECGGGQYVWAKNMIVMKEVSADAIRAAVASLIAAGELEQAFDGPFPIPGDQAGGAPNP